jgi:hypothetical protein
MSGGAFELKFYLMTVKRWITPTPTQVWEACKTSGIDMIIKRAAQQTMI